MPMAIEERDDDSDEPEGPRASPDRKGWFSSGLAPVSLDAEMWIEAVRDGRPELWIGTVETLGGGGFKLRVWGSRELMFIPWPSLKRTGTISAHTWREEQEVLRLQRRGLPARVLVGRRWTLPDGAEPPPPPQKEERFCATRALTMPRAQWLKKRRGESLVPTANPLRVQRAPLTGRPIPITDDHLTFVGSYARQRGLTLQQAINLLFAIARRALGERGRLGSGQAHQAP